METKTVPFGSRMTAKVEKIAHGAIFLLGSNRQGYCLLRSTPSVPIEEGDTVVMEFRAGGPTGGHWQIIGRYALYDMCVIYESPGDHPGKFVMRRWNGIDYGQGTQQAYGNIAFVADTVEGARSWIPPHINALLSPSPEDDPSLREVWI